MLLPGSALAQQPPAQPSAEPELSTRVGPLTLTPSGRVRAAYDWVANDPDVDFVGDNSGFNVRSARVGIEGVYGLDEEVSFKLSIETASELRERFNTPAGELEVRARDAFVAWTPHRYLRIAMGQLKVPFDYENWRGTTEMPFASRAVGQEGVPGGFGFEEPGIVVDRDIGVRVMPSERLRFGPMGLLYVLAVGNGNGENQVLDDNGKPAFYGRLELDYEELVFLGGGLLYNERRVGDLPNLFDEKDLGFAVDLRTEWKGLEVGAQVVQVTTQFDTLGTEDRKRLAYHLQAAWEFDLHVMLLAPGYRFAVYEPWAGASDNDGNDVSLQDFRLTYHTVGLRVSHPDSWLDLFVNYTLTQEKKSRSLDNDRLEVLTQVAF